MNKITLLLIVNLIISGCSQPEKAFTITQEKINSQQLDKKWITSIQQNADYNIVLDNGDLLLGNKKYPALSYSGYRKETRGKGLPNRDEYCPTVAELKEDMQILAAMGVKLIRTYDTQEYDHAPRLLKAIHELKKEDPAFEMYVMLGAWIQCEGAYTDSVNHSIEDADFNKLEMDTAIKLAATYPDIVKIIAVGNEAMVTWQAHWVTADVILKWVLYAKAAMKRPVKGYLLPDNVLLTSSDNFAPWGAEESYRNDDLKTLIGEVDFISMHTYPFHDTHYNSDYWQTAAVDKDLAPEQKVQKSMTAAFEYAVNQYNRVQDYLKAIDKVKAIHIGETGWATVDDDLYTTSGSGAADEIKMKIYYDAIRQWTYENNISCFYFEAFNEPWKGGELGSESHFGLFTVDGKAKYALWELVDRGTFAGLTRGGNPIMKTYNGDFKGLTSDLLIPPIKEKKQAPK